jgi:hypothetical protein
MTVNLVRGSGDRLTMRDIPVLAWLFIALNIYRLGVVEATRSCGSSIVRRGNAPTYGRFIHY